MMRAHGGIDYAVAAVAIATVTIEPVSQPLAWGSGVAADLQLPADGFCIRNAAAPSQSDGENALTHLRKPSGRSQRHGLTKENREGGRQPCSWR